MPTEYMHGGPPLRCLHTLLALSLMVPWLGTALAADAAPPIVALARATPEQIEQAFVFASVAFFPNGELVWVRHKDSRRRNDLGDMMDRAGRWLGPAAFTNPNLSGDASPGLFPAQDESRLFGYINGRGEWVIRPQFQGAEPFVNGRAGVFVGPGERRTIDRDGQFVSADGNAASQPAQPAQQTTADGQALDWVQPGFRGLVPAALRGKVGVLDAKHQWHLQPTLEAAAVNSDGTVLAQRNGVAVFFDAAGGELPAARSYRTMGVLAEGLTPACQGVRCGYLGPGGDWVIAPRFERVSTFGGGMARVMLNGLVAHIDRSGRFITPEPPALAAAPWLWRPGAIHDANSNNGGTAFGFIDRSGKLVIAPVFSNAGDFGAGLAPVQSTSGAFGYVDAQGRWKLPPVFRSASAFVDGLALAQGCGHYGSRWCHIDPKGKEQVVLADGIESAGPFESGRAWLRGYDGKTKWVDRQGNPASAPALSEAPPELQRLSINGGPWGFADANDRFVIAPRFNDVGEFAQGLAPVKLGELWGFVERSGRMAIQPAYDEVAPFSDGLARVRKGETWGYINRQGKTLATLPFVFVADFHDGLARVGMELEAAKRLAAGVPADAKDVPDFIGSWPPMLGDGGEVVRGLTWVKRVRGFVYAGDWMALMNARGELIVPAPWTDRPAHR
jgi:hypothetical protein